MIECLPSMCKALVSIPSTGNKRKTCKYNIVKWNICPLRFDLTTNCTYGKVISPAKWQVFPAIMFLTYRINQGKASFWRWEGNLDGYLLKELGEVLHSPSAATSDHAIRNSNILNDKEASENCVLSWFCGCGNFVEYI